MNSAQKIARERRRESLGRTRRRSPLRTALIASGCLVLVVAIIAAGTYFAVASRIRSVELQPNTTATSTETRTDTVYLLVGADSGIDRAVQEAQYTADGSARADIIVLIRVDDAQRATVLSVPRDLLTDYDGYPTRLALTYLDGPSALAEAICGTLGVEVDRLVAIDTKSFVRAVDQLGGLEIELDYAIRDAFYGLELPQGRQTIDGEQAFGLVRSRFAEQYIDGEWIATGEVGGSRDRAKWGGRVLKSIKEKLMNTDLATASQGLWDLADKLTLGGGTSIEDLQRLVDIEATNAGLLPAKAVPGGGIAVEKSQQTVDKLESAGFDRSCRVPGQSDVEIIDGQIFEPTE